MNKLLAWINIGAYVVVGVLFVAMLHNHDWYVELFTISSFVLAGTVAAASIGIMNKLDSIRHAVVDTAHRRQDHDPVAIRFELLTAAEALSKCAERCQDCDGHGVMQYDSILARKGEACTECQPVRDAIDRAREIAGVLS